MGFLAGLFKQSIPELQVAVDVVQANASVEPGFLYRVQGSGDDTVTVTLRPHSRAELSGSRFAVKVFGGVSGLTVAVPVGQQIEADTGEIGEAVSWGSPALGLYREWLCDHEGVWMLVNRV